MMKTNGKGKETSWLTLTINNIKETEYVNIENIESISDIKEESLDIQEEYNNEYSWEKM